jgi:hypothetical protein
LRLWLVLYLHAKRVNAQIVQREITAWWNIVQLEGAPSNLVQFFDLIDRVEDFETVHCFDVINAAL